MAVKIRLSRVGTKNAPVYRIVATDSRNKRDGKALEILGTYNPCNNSFVRFEQDRIDAWVKQGAQLTDSIKKLCRVYKERA